MPRPFLALLIFLSIALPALSAPQLGSEDAPVVGVVLGKVIRTSDAEELRYCLLKEPTAKVAVTRDLRATHAEIDAHVTQVNAFMRRDAERRSKRLAEIERLLGDGSSPPSRAALEAELKNLQALQKGDTGRGNAPAAESAEETAAAFIVDWKIRRALYRRYGGRVIFQQAGPEALDAYRRFLEDAGGRGDFIIADAALAATFRAYSTDDARHSFMTPDEARRAFATPPWGSR